MSLLPNLRIAVIGAGVAGMTTAYALGRLGARRLAIYDQAANANALREPNTGAIISPNAVQLFDACNLSKQLYEIGQPIGDMTVRNPSDAVLERIQPYLFTKKHLRSGDKLTAVAIQRRALASLLLKNLPTSIFYFNHCVTSMHTYPESHSYNDNSNVSTSDQNHHRKKHQNHAPEQSQYELCFSGSVASQPADLIIAADGIQSTIRSRLFPSVKVTHAGGMMVQGLVNFTDLNLQSSSSLPWYNSSELAELWGNGQRFGFVHVGENNIWWYATLHSSVASKIVDMDQVNSSIAASTPSFSPETFASLFTSFPEHIQLLIKGTPSSRFFSSPIVSIPSTATLNDNGIVLVGDAAFSPTIDGHQQVAQSIEGAFTLAMCLSASTSLDAALNRYSSLRQSRTSQVSQYARSRTDHALVTGKLLTSVRNIAAGLMPKVYFPEEKLLKYNVLDHFPELPDSFNHVPYFTRSTNSTFV